jgi:hypothetical protein
MPMQPPPDTGVAASKTHEPATDAAQEVNFTRPRRPSHTHAVPADSKTKALACQRPVVVSAVKPDVAADVGRLAAALPTQPSTESVVP